MKIRVIILASIGGIFLLWPFFPSSPKFKITFFDIGQGDAALIEFINGKKLLIDCGADKRILAKLGQATSFNERTIDYLVITHFDLDHYGGCVDVLKRYQVKNIITNGLIKDQDPYWRVWDRLKEKEGAETIIVKAPQTITIASSTLEFLNPFVGIDLKPDDHNNRSVVFKLTRDGKSVLFVGDIEEPAEKEIIRKYCLANNKICPALRSNVLKIGHHGSDTSSSREFLEAVAPAQAVISVGKDNKFGHPSLRVLRRLERLGVSASRTDLLGNIVVLLH